MDKAIADIEKEKRNHDSNSAPQISPGRALKRNGAHGWCDLAFAWHG